MIRLLTWLEGLLRSWVEAHPEPPLSVIDLLIAEESFVKDTWLADNGPALLAEAMARGDGSWTLIDVRVTNARHRVYGIRR